MIYHDRQASAYTVWSRMASTDQHTSFTGLALIASLLTGSLDLGPSVADWKRPRDRHGKTWLQHSEEDTGMTAGRLSARKSRSFVVAMLRPPADQSNRVSQ